MTGSMPHACSQMQTYVTDPRLPVGYIDRFREYWISLLAGHRALQLITFCPWCGVKLPGSLRDDYFNALEQRGLDADIATELTELPAEFRDGSWWRRADSGSPML